MTGENYRREERGEEIKTKRDPGSLFTREVFIELSEGTNDMTEVK